MATGSPAQVEGGYECEFVDCNLESLLCPFCTLPLRDPHLLSCCGAKYCEVCIDRVKSSGQPCPLCKQQFTTLLDKDLQRKVLELKVRCPNKKWVCSWEGELRHLHVHEKEECGGTLVKCRFQNCDRSVPRRLLAEHENNACPEKTLMFCKTLMKEEERKLTSTVVDYVSKTLKAEGERHERGLERKLDEQKRVLMSDYDAKMKRMEEKLDAVEQKFTKEMSELQHVITRQTRDIEDSLNAQKRDLATKIDMLKKESDCLKRELELETRKLAVEYSGKMKILEESLRREVKILEESLRSEVNQVILQMRGIFHIFHPLIGLEFVMTDYSKHKKAQDSWNSTPFYTGLGGYKLHLCVSLDASTLSVWLYPMMGDYDDKLVWPFCADITAKLVNQEKDMNHFEKTVSIKPQDRITSKLFASPSPALILSIPRSVVESKSGNIQFIKHDRLMFQVTGIVVRSN